MNLYVSNSGPGPISGRSVIICGPRDLIKCVLESARQYIAPIYLQYLVLAMYVLGYSTYILFLAGEKKRFTLKLQRLQLKRHKKQLPLMWV